MIKIALLIFMIEIIILGLITIINGGNDNE